MAKPRKPVVSIRSEPLGFHRLKAVVSSRMNTDAEAGSSPERKDDGPFGPLRHDWPGRENGTDRADSESGELPASTGEVAVRRGELAVLKGAGASVIYEMAVRCFLEMGRPAVLVDGGCQADPYEVAAIAKRMGRETNGAAGSRQQAAGTLKSSSPSALLPFCHSAPSSVPFPNSRELVDSVLRNLYVARAFTAHQMEALIVERLGPMVERVRPVFVGVMSIDALFRDDQLDRYEAKIMQARCTKTLRRMAKDSNLMVVATGSVMERWGAKWW